MDKNLLQTAKAPMIALINPQAPKGRPDINHGCNPWTETTRANHGCKPQRAFLLLLLALVAIATTARAQITVFHDNVKYVLHNDGTAYVDLSKGAWGTLNLRETVSYNALTCTVTRIADGAFSDNKQITGNLTIPNTVTHIGAGAFQGCSGLNGTLTLPTALLHIGNGAFRECGFTGALTLPDGLLTIGNNAFYQCTGLTGQLNLPTTLTSIGSSAFSDCDGFSGSLTLPPLLTEIKDQTFYGIQFTGDLVVPDGVTAIGDDAFLNNKFSSITIGNGVTTIGNYAFRLTAADQLTLGSSVASIGDEAFRYDEDGSHDHIINIKCLNAVPAALGVDVFKNHWRWMVEVPCGARDAYISSSGWGLSHYGINLNISVPRIKVELMGVYYLLNPCDGTATVTHSGYTEADENNNSYDGSIYSTIVIPSTVEHEGEIYRVTRIGAYAFRGASEVRIVEIGNYVESIGNYAFGRVNNLIQVICHNPVPPECGADVFNAPDAITEHLYSLIVPCGSVEAYQNAPKWNSFKNFGTLDFKAKVEINGIHYVLYCDGTANVTHAGYTEENTNNGSYSGYVSIPETVTHEGETYIVNRIGNNAFKGCTALTSVTVGDNVYDIGSNAFSDCTALSSITSERVTPPALGSNVFLNVPTSAVLKVPCTAVEAYLAAAQWNAFPIQGTVLATINAQIDGVYYVLNPCAGTATVTNSGYVEYADAHYQNSYSGAVTIPATVTHEGRTYDVTRIGQYAFSISINLTSVIIGENVIHISPYAFNGCSALTSVIIGEKVNTINYYAFNGCSSLGSITSLRPVPPTLIGDDVFRNVPTTAKLYVPCSAVETYAAAGGWNRFETISEIYYQIGDIYYSICNGTATVVGHPSYAMLQSVYINDSITVSETDYPVTAIADTAFSGCAHLKWFDCHANLLSIGDHALRNCDSLNYLGLYQTDTPPTVGEGAFEGLVIDTLRLTVPFCSQYEYSQHEVFGQFGTIMGNGACEYNFHNATGDNQWDNPANWQDASYETCTEAPGAGAQVAIFSDCEIGEDVTVGSVTIGSYIVEEWGYYERLTVKSGNTLTASNFIYTSGDERSFIIEDGAQVYHPNTGAQATVEKNITAYTPNSKDGWHLVSSPAIESFAPSVDNGFLANEYDLYFYEEPTHYWRNYKPSGQYAGFYIAPLKGYLYANSANDTLGLTGTLRPATETVNIPLRYTDGIELAGFNLVGNPFAHNVTTFTGSNITTEIYRMNGTKDNLVVSVIDGNNPLKPGEGFFVKAMAEDASITFNDNGGAKGGAKALESVERPTIALEISQNGLLIDRLILKTEGAPLEKFTLNENGTKIYATEDGQDWAVAVIDFVESSICSEAKQSIPVNFKTAKNGTYTLTVNVENMELDYLHLIDNMTGADVDLLFPAGQGDYTFTAKTTDYASRFRLVFSINCGDAIGDNAPFAYVSNGNIVVVGNAVGDAGTASLQVVDVMGRVLVCRDALNASAISITGIPAGVYVLRLIDGENLRTQKMVID